MHLLSIWFLAYTTVVALLLWLNQIQIYLKIDSLSVTCSVPRTTYVPCSVVASYPVPIFLLTLVQWRKYSLVTLGGRSHHFSLHHNPRDFGIQGVWGCASDCTELCTYGLSSKSAQSPSWLTHIRTAYMLSSAMIPSEFRLSIDHGAMLICCWRQILQK